MKYTYLELCSVQQQQTFPKKKHTQGTPKSIYSCRKHNNLDKRGEKFPGEFDVQGGVSAETAQHPFHRGRNTLPISKPSSLATFGALSDLPVLDCVRIEHVHVDLVLPGLFSIFFFPLRDSLRLLATSGGSNNQICHRPAQPAHRIVVRLMRKSVC